MIIFGHQKRGKSYIGDTAPAPRLILDAEAGSRFTPSTKTNWDPSTQKPPESDGTWETAIVTIRNYRDVSKAYEWLNSGQHPFRSVVIDSISETQQRLVDDLAGTAQMSRENWGALLRQGSDLIRKFRDLVTNPVRPLDAVILIAMAKQSGDGIWRPYLQGQLSTTAPYYVDVCGFVDLVPAEDGRMARRLFVGPMPGYETGERVGGRLGSYIDIPDGDRETVVRMLKMIRNGTASEKSNAVPRAASPAAANDPWLPRGQEA